MLLISKTCNYGIRASLYVASRTDSQFVPIRQISEGLKISFHFLTKILQILTQKNIMTSYRGPNGGVSLARPASSITIMEIIEAIDGSNLFQGCILGLPECNNNNPCPLHEKWAVMREDLKLTFQQANLSELTQRIKEFGLRISEP
jgi:Rrf2 family iron-sulfur cluster assembly transcriptional regulator